MATWDATQIRRNAIGFISKAACFELELNSGSIIMKDDEDDISFGADANRRRRKSVKLVREPSFSTFAFQVREYFVCTEPLRELWQTVNRTLNSMHNDLYAAKKDMKGIANKRMVERDYITKAEQHIISLVKSCISAKSVQA